MPIIKIIIYLLRMLIATIITIYYSFLIIFKPNLTPVFFNKSKTRWAYKLIKLFSVKLEVIGKENIADNQNYIFISNHQSLFDIPVVFYTLPENSVIIYKQELEDFPVFGSCMKKSPLISIKRENARNSMAGLDKAIESMKENLSVIIYPEGTRSKDGTIGQFKRGAFLMATRAEKPIVPVVLIGTKEVLDKKSRKIFNHKVEVQIFKPISIDHNLNKVQELALMNEVREIILKNYKK